jgi:aspartate aminotransferase
VTCFFGKKFGDKVINNATDLCMYLLDHAHVALVPGDAFGNPDCVRISYAASKELLTEAMLRLKNAFAELH